MVAINNTSTNTTSYLLIILCFIVNLQTPTSGESMKVEVGDIPPGLDHASSGNTDDSVSQPGKKDQHQHIPR